MSTKLEKVRQFFLLNVGEDVSIKDIAKVSELSDSSVYAYIGDLRKKYNMNITRGSQAFCYIYHGEEKGDAHSSTSAYNQGKVNIHGSLRELAQTQDGRTLFEDDNGSIYIGNLHPVQL